MKRRGLILGLLFGLTVAALAGWFFYTFEWVEAEAPLPPRGEARYNQLYALGRTLQQSGVDVVSRPTLHLDAMALAAGDVLVLSTEIRTLGEEQVSELLDWVSGGGHLVFALPQSDAGSSPVLLDWLDLSLVESRRCVHWRVPHSGNEGPTDPPADSGEDGTADVADALDEGDHATIDDDGDDGDDEDEHDYDHPTRLCSALSIELGFEEGLRWALPAAAETYLAAHVDYGDGSWMLLRSRLPWRLFR
jgi:hypothetical protein